MALRGLEQLERQALPRFGWLAGLQIVAASKAMLPRWHPFIRTGLLGGLRRGESAALHESNIGWRRGRLHVQREFL